MAVGDRALWLVLPLCIAVSTPALADMVGPYRQEDHLFAFAVIADSHIRVVTSDDYRYLKAESISRELLAAFVRDINSHTPPMDFVVHLGDVTDGGTLQEFTWARAIMDSLRCPLYPVVGNHDNAQSDHKQNWKDFAGLDSTHYSFDYFGINFIVIDCTMQPYIHPYVACDHIVRGKVSRDLALKPLMPTIILTHYNMWERHWNAGFDTTESYGEYVGVPLLRNLLEDAGNVIAVINGHVHANRAEVHNDIYYMDVNATLVGKPSIRYFYVYHNRIEVDYAYISDEGLLNHVQSLCPWCVFCFDPDSVCAFIDGAESDKRFTIYYDRSAAGTERAVPVEFEFEVGRDAGGRIRARISSEYRGLVEISLHDVLGRRIDICRLSKNGETLTVDLLGELPALRDMPDGIYFVSVSLGGTARTRKLPLF